MKSERLSEGVSCLSMLSVEFSYRSTVIFVRWVRSENEDCLECVTSGGGVRCCTSGTSCSRLALPHHHRQGEQLPVSSRPTTLSSGVRLLAELCINGTISQQQTQFWFSSASLNTVWGPLKDLCAVSGHFIASCEVSLDCHWMNMWWYLVFFLWLVERLSLKRQIGILYRWSLRSEKQAKYTSG